MGGRLACAIACAAAMPASANPDAAVYLCGPPPTGLREDVPLPTSATVAGTYRCSTEGITITLTLKPDGRFEQRLDAEVGDDPYGEARDMEREFALKGRWRLDEFGGLVLFETPVRNPRIKLLDAKRDPSVWLQVEVRHADGTPADGLLIAGGESLNEISALTDGVLRVPRDYGWEPGRRVIVRGGDERQLIEIAATRDGPNVFRYRYEPSEVEPFEIKGGLGDAKGRSVVIPFGIAGAVLRRVD